MFAFPDLRVITVVRDQATCCDPGRPARMLQRLARITTARLGLLGEFTSSDVAPGPAWLRRAIASGRAENASSALAKTAWVGALTRRIRAGGRWHSTDRYKARNRRIAGSHCAANSALCPPALCISTFNSALWGHRCVPLPAAPRHREVGGAGMAAIACCEPGQPANGHHLAKIGAASTDCRIANGRFGYIGTIRDHLARAQEIRPTV